MTNTFTALRCVLCGAEYEPRLGLYVCPKHGDSGNLDVQYDYAAIGRRIDREMLTHNPVRAIWRYLDLLPLQEATKAAVQHALSAPVIERPLWQVGGTPLYIANTLAATLGLRHLYVKDDGRNHTASFKDRASAIAVLKAQEEGQQVIAGASTGNAASSLAGLAAGFDIEPIIFVPQSAPQAKVAQLLVFGARVLPVRGTYDQAFDLCLAACKAFGWYCRNTGYNPYMSEGKKTVSYEICEALAWQAPDRIFVSVGDGCIIGGVYKGLKDLLALGWIDHMPQVMGVQAENSNALAATWARGGEEIMPVNATTLADSISVDLPRDGVKALRAVRESGGAFVTVSDDEILSAIRQMGRHAGIFAEPAGATAYAGLAKLARAGAIDVDERIVVINSGSGLKDVRSAIQAVGGLPEAIEPTLDSLRAKLGV